MNSHIAAGKLRLLCVGTPHPWPLTPAVGSVLTGFPAQAWFALLAPAGTPQPVVARLNASMRAVLDDAGVRQQLGMQGVDIAGGSPADLDSFLKDDTRKWAELVKSTGIKLLD